MSQLIRTSRADQMFAAGRDAGEKALSAFGMSSSTQIFGGHVNAEVIAPGRDESRHKDQYKYARKGVSYASIRPIANRIAAQRLRMARSTDIETTRSFKSWERDALPEWVKESPLAALDPLQSHRLLSAVRRPNDYMVEWMLMWCTAFSLEATGNSYWLFVEKRGDLQIWPVPTHWVKPGPNGKWIISIGDTNHEPYEAEHGEVCRFYIPDPADPMSSMCSLSAAAPAILTDDAIQTSQERSFQAPMPAYAFTIGERTDADGIKRRPELTSDQRREVNEQIRQMHAGPNNAVRALLLDALITSAQRLTPPNTEMDYMASMKVVSRRIEKIYGTNPILMGEVENANRASSTVADKIHLEVVINPRLEMIGQVLTAFVARSPLFNDKSVLCYYKPVVARDPELEQKDWQYARTHGIVSDDDFRIHRLGLPPKKEGGDYARMNFQLVPVLVDGKPEMSPVPQAGPLGNDANVQRSIKAATGTAWSRMHAKSEKVIADSVAGVMDTGITTDGQSVFVDDGFTDSLKSAIRDSLRAAAMSGASVQESLYKHTAANFQKDVSDIIYGLDGMVPIAVEREIDALLSQPYWAEMGESVADELRVHLRRFVSDGMAQEDIAAALREKLPEISSRRAMRIATSETTFAMNAGAWAVREELADSGAITGSEWNSILDNRTRGADPDDTADHVVMDGVRVGPNELFDVGGESARFPGDYSLSAKNRVHCRCFATAISAFE